MEKSKFKSVKFKPLNLELEYACMHDNTHAWESSGKDWHFLRFPEEIIDVNLELFEVEKAEREFEEGAWYKLHSHKYKDGYTLGYYYELLNCFYIVGTNVPHYLKDFDKIGEKIEL